jgi:hypothetical protein
MIGAGRGTRTPDLRFTKPLLYQLSYAGNPGRMANKSPNEVSKSVQLAAGNLGCQHLTRRLLYR